jgi:hypothetical protein
MPFPKLVLDLLQDSFDPICNEDIRALESELGVAFPHDYVEFLLAYNSAFRKHFVVFDVRKPGSLVWRDCRRYRRNHRDRIMKHATIYCKTDGWYLHPDSKTTVGVYIGTPPHLRLDIGVSSEDLGKAIHSALAGSRCGVPHPTDWDKVVRPTLDLARVKTWRGFAKDARCVSILLDDKSLMIETWSKDQHMNFVAGPDASRCLPHDASAAEIGDAVKRAVALCT